MSIICGSERSDERQKSQNTIQSLFNTFRGTAMSPRRLYAFIFLHKEFERRYILHFSPADIRNSYTLLVQINGITTKRRQWDELGG